LELTISIVKSFMIMMAISSGCLMFFAITTMVWIRRNSKGKVFSIFIEPNREITSELITIDTDGALTPEKIRSKDGGDYLISPDKMFWSSWPPGFPVWLREPIPSALYLRNRFEPIDPQGSRSIGTARALRYMTDEAMLKQTWDDAREALGEGSPAVKKNLASILSGAAVVGVIIITYMVWTMQGRIDDIAKFIGA